MLLKFRPRHSLLGWIFWTLVAAGSGSDSIDRVVESVSSHSFASSLDETLEEESWGSVSAMSSVVRICWHFSLKAARRVSVLRRLAWLVWDGVGLLERSAEEAWERSETLVSVVEREGVE